MAVIQDIEFKASLVAYGAGQVYSDLPEVAKRRYRAAVRAYYDGMKACDFVHSTKSLEIPKGS